MTNTFLSVLLRAKRDDWSRTAVWALWTFFGSALPFLIVVLGFLIFSRPLTIMPFVVKGDLLIAAAGLMIPALMALIQDREPSLKKHQLPFLFGIVILLASCVTYGYLSFSAVGNLDAPKTSGTNSRFIQIWTGAVIIVSALFAVCVRVVEESLSSVSPQQIRAKTENDLAGRITKLGAEKND